MHERLVQAEGHFNPKGLNPDEPRGFFCVFKAVRKPLFATCPRTIICRAGLLPKREAWSGMMPLKQPQIITHALERFTIRGKSAAI
jgi:hypothetical protein